MTYKAIYKCKKCDETLSFAERVNNIGVCPKCGVVCEGMEVDCYKASEEQEDKLVNADDGWGSAM